MFECELHVVPTKISTSSSLHLFTVQQYTSLFMAAAHLQVCQHQILPVMDGYILYILSTKRSNVVLYRTENKEGFLNRSLRKLEI
jgi:CRISPR/Cas system-associated exonuclease Cas4 (RecB family)